MTKTGVRAMNRSGTETCPLCSRKRRLIGHHINGRKVPDWDNTWNRASICDTCHRDVHEYRVIIDGWVYTTAGRTLEHHKA